MVYGKSGGLKSPRVFQLVTNKWLATSIEKKLLSKWLIINGETLNFGENAFCLRIVIIYLRPVVLGGIFLTHKIKQI